MSVVTFCHAAGCREAIPVGQYFCKKHSHLQKEYEEKRKHWRREQLKGMTKEQRHEYNKREYKRRMTASAKAPHDYDRFYKTARWEHMSHRWLQNHPVCVSCLRKGIIRKGDVVDHIVELKDDWSKRLDPNNLQTLCYACHNRKTRKEKIKRHERAMGKI